MDNIFDRNRCRTQAKVTKCSKLMLSWQQLRTVQQCDKLKESPWSYRRTRTNCPVLSTSFECVSARDVSMHAVESIPLISLEERSGRNVPDPQKVRRTTQHQMLVSHLSHLHLDTEAVIVRSEASHTRAAVPNNSWMEPFSNYRCDLWAFVLLEWQRSEVT